MYSARSLAGRFAVGFTVALLGAVPALAAPRQLAAEFPTETPLVAGILGVERVQIADVDGDGFNDIVGLSGPKDALVWLRHRGTSGLDDGTYDAARTLVRFLGDTGGFSQERGLAIGDTNGDGLVDFYVNSDFESEVLQVMNLGAGQVAAPVVVLSPATFSQVSVGPNLSLSDVDSDGDLDLIVPNRLHCIFSCTPAILENNGGQMIPWGSSPTFEVPGGDLAFADLDGDGDLDIAVAGTQCRWLENVGGQYVRHPNFFPVEAYSWVEVEDLDLDGDLDLLYYRDGAVAVLDNSDGMGAWLSSSTLVVPGGRPIVMDVDADGDADLFTLGLRQFGASQVIPSWWENMGGQGFAAPVAVTSDVVGNVRSAQLGDLNGDGYQDVLLARGGARLTAILGQAPVGQLAFESSTTDLARLAGGLFDVITADTDGDDDLDIITSSLTEGLQVRLQVSLPGAATEIGDRCRVLPTVTSSRECQALDLNDDQLPDLVFLTGDDSLAVALNVGGGNFAAPLFLGLPGAYDGRPQALDLDSDGDLDLVIGDDANRELVAFDQVAQGQFATTARTLAPLSAQCNDLALTDLDGDGALDLLVTVGFRRHLAFIPDGLGGVDKTLLQLLPSGDISNVIPCELNGDGHVDLAWIDFGTREIHGRLGGPGLAFQPEEFLQPAPFNSIVLHGAHLNTDGVSDFVIGLGTGHMRYASRSLSTAPMTWSPQEPLTEIERNGGVLTVADLDGDGDIDVVTGPSDGPFLSLYRNELFSPIGASECGPGVPNSTGSPSTMNAVGSADLADRSVLLRVSELPANELTLFLASQTAGFVAGPGGSAGNLCLAGAVGRFRRPGEVLPSTAAGTAELGVNLSSLPQPTMAVSAMAGQTWRFQVWHTDQVGGQLGSNFSDAIAVTF